ncbi:MAG: Holliday junction branch migration protein RuvA [Clostridiales bacterium]|nr:Holliday junction branch migration protein RuvA [Clostridiales bacterium]
MFYYINGIVSEIEPNLAVIDCGGVGYACHTTSRTLSLLNKGEKAKLFTYCHIREDAFDIYGFFKKSEHICFKMLIGISGVGPKAALSILSAGSPEDLAVAVMSGNEKALTIAPGIGKKIAQRIILELKDKMGKEISELAENGVSFQPDPGNAQGGKAADAAAALSVLGYSPSEINSGLRNIDVENLSTEQIIREVLKKSLK